MKKVKIGFIVMEKFEGETLKDYLRDGTRDKQELNKVGKKVFQILKDIEEKAGIYHGDVHAGNIMVNPQNDTATLLDFGYSKPIKDVSEPNRMNSQRKLVLDKFNSLSEQNKFDETVIE